MVKQTRNSWVALVAISAALVGGCFAQPAAAAPNKIPVRGQVEGLVVAAKSVRVVVGGKSHYLVEPSHCPESRFPNWREALELLKFAMDEDLEVSLISAVSPSSRVTRCVGSVTVLGEKKSEK